MKNRYRVAVQRQAVQSGLVWVNATSEAEAGRRALTMAWHGETWRNTAGAPPEVVRVDMEENETGR